MRALSVALVVYCFVRQTFLVKLEFVSALSLSPLVLLALFLSAAVVASCSFFFILPFPLLLLSAAYRLGLFSVRCFESLFWVVVNFLVSYPRTHTFFPSFSLFPFPPFSPAYHWQCLCPCLTPYCSRCLAPNGLLYSIQSTSHFQ